MTSNRHIFGQFRHGSSRHMKRPVIGMLWVMALIPIALLLSSCDNGEAETDERPFVVTTTNLIRDAVERVGGEEIRTVSLMGPGVDPHIYRATPRDFRRMEQADLILYNGHFLEGRLAEILARQGERARAVTEQIPSEKLIEASDFGGTYDPHVWFDAELWRLVIDDVAMALSQLQPENAGTFQRRAQEYNAELRELHEYALEQIRRIPEQQRILITAHDAFQYFSRAYGIEVRGLQGLSTATEFGVQDVTRMVSLITERRVPAIFVESSVSTRSIESVIAGVRQRGYEVRIGGTLFSDSMGARGTPEGTYAGMFRHNVDTIVEALTPGMEHADTEETL
ncbi:zinc ABC transporter substrate-binding protein [Balneolales bacterium ANBcel1]|nr:zinc ABC transporter substrate-binding protein [Balneolales bacterium ANBcel1]